MKYRELGNTGMRVSAIALGCEGFMGKDRESVKSDFDYAISHGINFIDIYSPNPELRAAIGYALEARRNSFFIQSHIGTTWENGQYLRTRDSAKTEVAFEESLKLLRTDYLDVGMIHYVDDERDFHKVFDGGIIELAKKWKSEGRIRHIGMSSHNPVIAQMAVKSGMIDILLFSINPCYDMQPASEDVEDLWKEDNYSRELCNIDPEREQLYELCENRGVGIDVMKVYGGGDILSEQSSPFGHALTPVQCIEYALTRPGVAAVMVGCKSISEIGQALEWCDATDAMKDYASAIAGMERYTWRGHCMYCGHCAPCTKGIDIASVNKFYNLTVAQGMIPETVREHYKALSHHAGECVECGRCEKNCPFGVEIIKGMRLAKDKFKY